MIKIIDLETEQLTDFEKKYLFTEAPGEKERVNVKRISLRAPDKRTYDFRRGADDDPDDVNTGDEDQSTENIDADEPDTTDDMDADDGSDDESDIVTDDESIEFSDDDTEEDPEEMDDNSIVTDDENEDPDLSADDTEESDGDSDIVTDDDPDISADDESDQGNSDDSGENDDGSSGDENDDEKIHKQNLFKKFITLRTSIENYNAKLSSMIGIDAETHGMIAEISDKLKSLGDMMYDYMIIKFKRNSYVQSMLFYQRTIAAVNLCLDSLDDIRKLSIKDDKSIKKKRNNK